MEVAPLVMPPPVRRRLRVLYLGVGTPFAPATGMDMVSRAHLDELRADPGLEVTTVIVAAASATPQAPAPEGVTLFMGEAAGPSRLKRAASRIAYAATRIGTLIGYAFRSEAAQEVIAAQLAPGRHDVVVVDHFMVMTNITLATLRASGAAVVFIAHDVTSDQLRDIGRMKGGGVKSLPYVAEAMKIDRCERVLFQHAARVVFLSEHDRREFPAFLEKSLALLPIPQDSPTLALTGAEVERNLVFMGSPNYLPNRFAIDWLVEEFAPALLKADASIRVVLMGKGTEAYDRRAENVVGCGFVSDEAMLHLVDGSLGVICPIVYGNGIKIKVLDALARRCPVFATEEALRGFEQFGIAPVIDVKKAAATAAVVAAMVADAGATGRERARLAAAWREYRGGREGRLAALVREVVAS